VKADSVPQRLSYPYIYGYPIFRSAGEVGKYANDVTRGPSLGCNLRSFQFRVLPPPGSFPSGCVDDSIILPLKHVEDILSRSPQLTRISTLSYPDEDVNYAWFFVNSLHISWEIFGALANTVGPVLEFLGDVFIHGDTRELRCPSILGQFSALRVFGCCIFTRFRVVKDRTSSPPVHRGVSPTTGLPFIIPTSSLMFRVCSPIHLTVDLADLLIRD